jgi:type II secretory pathway component GspD/PulD (secretin)
MLDRYFARNSVALRVLAMSVGLALAGAWCTSKAQAQTPSLSESSPGMVQLNLPNEVELKVLADYVSQRLGTKILYDEEIANKRISVRAPGEVPIESLMGLLQSALKMKGMALVDADVPGWKRIVGGAKLAAVAPAGDAQDALERNGAAAAVTQALTLQYADPQKVDQLIKPFLTQPGANSIAIKDPNILIITDYAHNLVRITDLVNLLDKPRPTVQVEFIPIRNVESASLVQQVNAVMAAKAKSQGNNAPGTNAEVANDPRANQIVVVGTVDQVHEALELVRAFDVPLGLQTETYSLGQITADRLDRLARQLVGPSDTKRLYQSAVDAEGNALIVTTTPEIHTQVRMLATRLDTRTGQQQYPVRLYRLKNTTATEVLETLRAIEGAGGQTPMVANRANPVTPASHNQVQGAIPLPLPPGQQQPAAVAGPEPLAAGVPLFGDGPSAGLPGGAKITADTNTNSLIVVAEPGLQRMYEELILSLDRRRPQVLIEAKIVAVDTSNNFSLGIELGGNGRGGGRQLVAFNSFGLSAPSAVNGALALIPGVGFNAALIDPSVADVVLRALSTHSRARVLASPRVLVNDNSKGQLESVLSIPFASVNASQTVATTSVGGNQDAGTTISVTPHISEGDHLQLEFSVQFSSFAKGNAAANLPPPRQIDQVQSTVTIPDGHTVIVGGLNRSSNSNSEAGIPVIDRIPVLKLLTSNRSSDDHCMSLFIFLRPTILRDDKFKDLKFLSDRDAQGACLPTNYPRSEPVLMR